MCKSFASVFKSTSPVKKHAASFRRSLLLEQLELPPLRQRRWHLALVVVVLRRRQRPLRSRPVVVVLGGGGGGAKGLAVGGRAPREDVRLAFERREAGRPQSAAALCQAVPRAAGRRAEEDREGVDEGVQGVGGLAAEVGVPSLERENLFYAKVYEINACLLVYSCADASVSISWFVFEFAHNFINRMPPNSFEVMLLKVSEEALLLLCP